MSNISRRKFLKGAGAAALAVAAAGVLAGCSKDDIPDVPGVTTRTAKVIFWFDHKTNTIAEGEVEVNVTATSIASSKLTLPAEVDTKKYYLKKGECPIEGGIVFAELLQTATSKTKIVKINYYSEAEGKQIHEEELEVEEYATYVNTSAFKEVPKHYELDKVGDLNIVDGYVYAPVSKKLAAQ